MNKNFNIRLIVSDAKYHALGMVSVNYARKLKAEETYPPVKRFLPVSTHCLEVTLELPRRLNPQIAKAEQ